MPRFFRMPSTEPMPERFKVLADYNAEVARGLVHTEDWCHYMACLQREFDDWLKKKRERP